MVIEGCNTKVLKYWNKVDIFRFKIVRGINAVKLYLLVIGVF